MCMRMDRSPFKYKNSVCFVMGLYIGYCIVYWLSVSILRQHMDICSKYHKTTTLDVSRLSAFPEPKDKFLLVAVMTTRKYLTTRAEAIYRTWGQRVPGRIVFFVGGSTAYKGNLPVVMLENITENTYPPQKKSFAMLKYVSTHFVDQYEWFMRSDDDVFVKMDRLERLLRSIDSTKTLYVGQPGTGTQEEAGKLGLHNSAPYCMGGPGVFFTRSTLRKIRNHLWDCLQHAVTLHEDTELGRCVQIHAGIACSNAFEFAQLFYQNYRNKSGSFTHKLGIAEERAVTLHPIKDHPHMFRLDSYFAFSRFDQLRTKIRNLSGAILIMSSLINTHDQREIPKFKPSEMRKRLRQLDGWSEMNKSNTKDKTKRYPTAGNEYQGEIWDFVEDHTLHSRYNMFQSPIADLSCRGKAVSYSRSKRSIGADSRYNRDDLFLLKFSYQRIAIGGVAENIHYLQKSDKSSTMPVRTVQHLSAALEVQEDESTDRTHRSIWIILPLYKRSRMFASFLATMTRAVELFERTVTLVVVLHVDDEFEYKKSKRQSDLHNNLIAGLRIKVLMVDEPFSRAKAITTGIKNLKMDSLLLIMDVDMVFNVKFLNRVILNTKLNKQAYFPIYFSRYDPKIVCYENKTCDIEQIKLDNHFGTWRYFSFGIVSIFKSDIQKVNGYRTDIKGWGKEDVDFYEKCLKSHLNVLRATDPFLYHIYHKRDCDGSLPTDQLSMCVQSRNQLYGYEGTLFKMSKKLKLFPV